MRLRMNAYALSSKDTQAKIAVPHYDLAASIQSVISSNGVQVSSL